MEIKRTGDMLRGIYGDDHESSAVKQFMGEESHYPISKTTSVGMRIDIYGEILSFTKEYVQGWRTFDLYACMYKEDGTGRDSLHDLIGNYSDDSSTKPLSCYIWVHPNHLSIESLFPALEPGRNRLVAGQYYLNRMGFVVHLEGSVTDSPKPILRDTHGNLYYSTGRRYAEHMSMTDLVNEITDWNYFTQSDWSEPDITKNGPKAVFSPEHYDPAAVSKEELRRRFYDALAEAHGLAKKIDATFTFTMDTTKR